MLKGKKSMQPTKIKPRVFQHSCDSSDELYKLERENNLERTALCGITDTFDGEEFIQKKGG